MPTRPVAALVAVMLAAGLSVRADPGDTTPLTFKDRGKAAVFPLGEVSFADAIVTYTAGIPAVRDKRFADPSLALGLPDHKGNQQEMKVPTSLVLGCGGSLTVRFTDNALVDVDGPDLYVFEVGPAIEPTLVAISADGRRWIDAGRIGGGLAALDIAKVAEDGEAYRYVRLTDARRACGGPYPGADIDAIGAIGSALQLWLDSTVLFDTGQSTLKPAARRVLDGLTTKLAAFPRARVTIEGHTDSVGSDAANQTLSEARARAVREFLRGAGPLQSLTFDSRGYGESRPVAANDTDAGRARNRRVALVVVPAK